MSGPDEVISSDADRLILVTPDDEDTGVMSKRDAHLGEGVLHRAFSVFIFNGQGHVLLQKRSGRKLLWPLHWSNACCSHPRAGEDAGKAAHLRLRQEMGVSTPLDYLYKFEYHARYREVGSEHELCWVWVGFAEASDITPNRNEVAEWRFFPREELDRELRNNPGLYTPWMKLEWERIHRDYPDRLRP